MDFTTIQRISKAVVLIIILFTHIASFSNPIRVGVGISGAPIVENVKTDQGTYYFGFCIDIMNNICERIGRPCIYSPITLGNQFDLLNSGAIDLLVLTKPYIPFDLKQYAISLPYAVSKIQFIALKNSSVNDPKDIKNKKIGVIDSTFYSLLLHSSYSKNNQIIPYNQVSDLLSDLTQNKIDLIGLNNAIAYSLATNNVYDIKLVGHGIPLGDGYGIIALSDKAPLIQEINQAILSIQRDGTYTSIYRKYYN